jgi:hypothetical protein
LEVYELANIKSAKKRILVTETKAARNKAIKSFSVPSSTYSVDVNNPKFLTDFLIPELVGMGYECNAQ